MTFLEVAAFLVLLLGIGAGGFMVAQRPSFWVEFAIYMGGKLKPVIAKRMTPEQEKQLHDCIRRGGEWDYFKKKCKK